ncbi:amidohydrolase family protein [Nocardioides sp. NPDC087217]|uniref:amidohydrolase family protein n=1 Tax=Nocardioides sp. NPDC087217 TaxID=3364335 RepID=UPI003812CA97
MRTLVLQNCDLIDGTGSDLQRGVDVVVEGDTIREVVPTKPGVTYERVDELVDVNGGLVIPGLINNHTHGTAYGPLNPSAMAPLSDEQVRANLDRHLLEGTTTLLCVDGFKTPDAAARTNDDHPISVRLASANTPACQEAASIADGKGLTEEIRAFTARQAVTEGAVALGEIGAGHTLGGGGASYAYIPAEVAKRTGVSITPRQADALKIAVLGRHISQSNFDRDTTEEKLVDAGLAGKLSVDEIREIIHGIILPSFDIALHGLSEAADIALKCDVPVLVHNAAASMSQVAKIAKTDVALIAGHSNHSTFAIPEALQHAERLKESGATVDVSTFDTFGAQRMITGPELLYAMFAAGLVDTISTDYAGGFHDPILLAIDHAAKEGVVSLPAAIQMATANVADAIPGLAPRRGRVVPGAIADIAVTDPGELARVRTVIVGGQVVAQAGKRVVA